MKKRFRLTLLAGAALGLSIAAVASAGQARQALTVTHVHVGAPSAAAAYTSPPELAVQQGSYKLGAATSPGFVIASDKGNDATAKITIYSPPGYTSTLGQTPGTTVGKAFALVHAVIAGLPIDNLPLQGPVVVGNPADPSLVTAYAQCRNPAIDPPTPQEALVLNTSFQGQTISVPDFVNTVTIGGSTYVTQEICLLPPSQAPFNAQLVLADFTVNGVWTNAPTGGQYQWVADFTPFNGDTPHPEQTVEVRTYVGLPSSFTLKRLKSKSSIVKFSGKLAIAGVSPAGLRVNLYYGLKSKPSADFRNPSVAGLIGQGKIAHPKALKSNGTFALTRKKVKKKTYFQARLEDEWALRDGCLGPSPTGQPIPCLQELLSPMTSNQILVKPPKKKRHHH
jgi:hypothetical protein